MIAVEISAIVVAMFAPAIYGALRRAADALETIAEATRQDRPR